jgi:hypothetical protein
MSIIDAFEEATPDITMEQEVYSDSEVPVRVATENRGGG